MNFTDASAAFIERVEDALVTALESPVAAPPLTRQADVLLVAARNLVHAGGKRARPWLTFAFGDAAGAPVDGLLDVAVSAELIHAASLLHDDVIDLGQERRGRPTANALWGNLAAVLSGDLLLTLALRQLRPHPARLTHEAIDVVASMTRASLVEAAARGRLDMSLAEWRAMASGKTGELFGLCGRAAALLVHDSQAADRFGTAALHLGVAFQLANDLDDLYGRTPGKDAQADLLNQNPCYPLLLAAGRSDGVRRYIEAQWASPDADSAARVAAVVHEAGAGEQSWAALSAEVNAATEALHPYADHPGTQQVLAWAHTLVARARPEPALEHGTACAAT